MVIDQDNIDNQPKLLVSFLDFTETFLSDSSYVDTESSFDTISHSVNNKNCDYAKTKEVNTDAC